VITLVVEGQASNIPDLLCIFEEVKQAQCSNDSEVAEQCDVDELEQMCSCIAEPGIAD
jgi:hypothetical protein